MTVRDAFFHKLYEKTKNGGDIVIVSSDLGAPSLDDFRKDFPNRFINVGIAEQNAIAAAAGLSVAGKKVITYGLNPFPVTRGFDHIRNFLASLQIPVTVTALNAGSCSADAGYTHMAVENMSIMRTLKGVDIINPSDEVIAELLVDELLERPKPRYVQFDKFINGKKYDKDCISFEKGYVSYGDYRETAVFTYGIFARKLMENKVQAKVFDLFKLPVSEEDIIEELKQCDRVFCVEDGVLNGGIGSMILEIMNRYDVQKKVEQRGLVFEDHYPHNYINRDLLWKREAVAVDVIVREINGGI